MFRITAVGDRNHGISKWKVVYLVVMIQIIQQGNYQITQTFKKTRLLSLDNKNYAWVNTERVEILVFTKNSFQPQTILARGRYRIYEVRDEKNLTDLIHLELYIGDGEWQGYLLPTGLPTKFDTKNQIIPTKEVITQTSKIRLLP